MFIFMHKYIDKIIGIFYDANGRFHVVFALIGKREENYPLVCHNIMKE